MASADWEHHHLLLLTHSLRRTSSAAGGKRSEADQELISGALREVMSVVVCSDRMTFPEGPFFFFF
jgi:hypothetical protein